MELNNMEKKRLLQVKAILGDVFDNGKLKKYRIPSIYIARDIASCYNSLIQSENRSTETILKDTCSFFEKKGFPIKENPNGNGWIICVSNRHS